MASYVPTSLPPRPITAMSSAPIASSSLRNVVQRKRSASLSDEGDSSLEVTASLSTPVIKKGRYERKELASGILGRALQEVSSQTASPLRASPASSRAASSTPAPATPQSQFQNQEDFISFGDDEPVTASGSRSRAVKTSSGIPNSAGGRVLDEYETKIEAHSKRVQKREKGRTTPWCDEPGVDWDSCKSTIEMLNLETHAFITYISPTPVEHELRMWTVELIRRAIKTRYKDAEVECFGSVGTGLYLPGGDIDLVVLCPSFPSPPLKPTSSLLHSLASLLLTSSLAEPSSLLVIAKSRVPIVKFVTRHGGFSVDLSVNQKNGVAAAVGVRRLLEDFSFRSADWIEPGAKNEGATRKGKQVQVDVGQLADVVDHGVARSLVLLVKCFLNQRGMNEVFTGGLGSYSIICLVVSFLQLHPKIQSGMIHPGKNIGLLFVEFLEYYGKHFNFDETGITLRKNGGYFNKHNKGWWRPNQPYLLSIEDPNDPTNDVSGGSHNIIRVRQTMAGAFEVLAATLCQRASAFALLSSDLPVSVSFELGKSALPTSDPHATNSLHQSVLGSVIGISLQSIRSRESNIDLFDEGILQDLIQRGMSKPIEFSKKAEKKLFKEEKAQRSKDRTLRKLELRQAERTEKIAKKEKRKREMISGETEIVEAPAKKLFVTGPTAIKSTVPTPAFFVDTEPSDSRYSIASPAPMAKVDRVSDQVFVNNRSDDDDSDFSSVVGAGDADVVMGGNDSGDRIRNVSKSTAEDLPDPSSDDETEAVIIKQLQKLQRQKPATASRGAKRTARRALAAQREAESNV